MVLPAQQAFAFLVYDQGMVFHLLFDQQFEFIFPLVDFLFLLCVQQLV